MGAPQQIVIETGELPSGALEAAAVFHETIAARVAQAAQDGASDVVLALPAAPYDHTDWRRTAARDLARAHAPVRVNVIGGGDAQARAATTAYLAGAHGITGQYLPLDNNGAGDPACTIGE
ncbi:Rossmann fold domain-containing protein [Qipengyuania sp. DSG2-2]|uniref:Rossmann fold domain-containing protein n=1 Tax=Qipengyuania sp. DGS2-2 TaxID=3349631 RepID=UPI0036D2CC17